MILLTGASGFIGSHLLNYIQNNTNVDVIPLTSKPLNGIKYLLHDEYSFDENLIKNAGYAEHIDTIIHAGAFTPINSNQANWIKECNKNISSLEKLLELCLPRLKKIIYLSTLDVYGEANVISESTNLEPSTLYGYSKLYGEKLVAVFAKQQDISSQILRIGHVYGPGEERYQKIIPQTIKRLIENEEIEIWGKGNELRSFIYIDDVVKAIFKSLDIDSPVGPINIVGDESISIRALVKEIISVSNKKAEVKFISTASQTRDFQFDNRKLKEYLLPQQTLLRVGLTNEWNYMINLR